MKYLQTIVYKLGTHTRRCSHRKGPGKQVGATAIEYALIAALVSIAMIAFLPDVGEEIKTTFENILTALQGAGEGGGEG